MEVKRTVLPPYGGSREEMGGGTSAWTYGRGVIGSPGAEQPTTPPAPRLIVVEPTINWKYVSYYKSMTFALVDGIPTELFESGANNHKLVITGGAYAGEYNISSSQISPFRTNKLDIKFTIQFPAEMDVDGIEDGGVASIVLGRKAADLNLSNAYLSYTVAGWGFAVSGNQVPEGLSNGDLITASGFTVFSQYPDGSSPINVNGNWTIDQLGTSNSPGGNYFFFTSPELRSAIGSLGSVYATNFGTGTVLAYDNAKTFMRINGDYNSGQVEGTNSFIPGRIYIIGPNINLQNAIRHGSSWQIRINNFSTTYSATAEVLPYDDRIVITPSEPMTSEFNNIISSLYWNVNFITFNEAAGTFNVTASAQT